MEIRNKNAYGPTNQDEIKEFEETLGLRLPDDFKAFLLEYNGGRPVNNIHPAVNTDIHWMLGLNKDPLWSSLYFNVETYANRLPKSTIPIAGDSGGNLFVMRLDETDYGMIGFWTHDTGSGIIEPLASSFMEFTNQLIPDE